MRLARVGEVGHDDGMPNLRDGLSPAFRRRMHELLDDFIVALEGEFGGGGAPKKRASRPRPKGTMTLDEARAVNPEAHDKAMAALARAGWRRVTPGEQP